jgi:alpha-L-rhamnosidase
MHELVVTRLRAEHRAPSEALGLGEPTPRLSWITETAAPAWWQQAYEVEVDGQPQGRVDSAASVLVPWPAPPLVSRQRAVVRVRVWGTDGTASGWSEPLAVEAGLLAPADWSARWITTTEALPADGPAPGLHLRRAFRLDPPTAGAEIARVRLYVTSAGVHQVHLNGRVVGDHVLAPGWSAYARRLHYDTHDVTALVRDGDNVVGGVVADGWWRGFLTWEMRRNVYGDRIGLLAQLEVTWSGGTVTTIRTDHGWRATTRGPVRSADLYQGEVHDARHELDGWTSPGYDDGDWSGVEEFQPKVGTLVSPAGPPVRRTEELPVQAVLTTPSGRTVLDFGQNLVGWVRFTVSGEAGTTVTLRHAEVLEVGELGTRPLRNATATDRYTLRGDGPETWSPAFTFHGFRYVEVDGWPEPDIDPDAFAAVVVHTDLERSGTFRCSDERLNRLHANVVWSMRGNVVGVPTDCPQRDERLGWTGDLQVFGPTAAYLYDVGGFLGDWLADLAAEQRADGMVPMVVPDVTPWSGGTAAWGDVATFLPWTLYQHTGDEGLLARQFPSMKGWVDWVAGRAGERRLWLRDFQFGDWVDPDAPPDEPGRAKTGAHLVATAYFARSAQIVSDAAAVLGRDEEAVAYGDLAAEVRAAFRAEYVTPNGRLSSDTVTAYALAVVFDLLDDPDHRARATRLMRFLARTNRYRISTGFVGTPLVLPALSAGGDPVTAYRLLTETTCPSWLYPVMMGATTVWERWDSLLPDGSINPSQMTSFNHYALGSVAAWMHEVIGGIALAAPGYARLRVAPVPGRGVTAAEATLLTPYGRASCRWEVDTTTVTLEVVVPPNASATVVRPGIGDELDVAAGHHRWRYDVAPETVARWADADHRPSS